MFAPRQHVATTCEARVSTAPARVVIVGGVFAGLESAFLLRLRLGSRVRLTLVSDRDTFLFKPNTIYIPFGSKLDCS
jgi:NADH dehydrogenase FAD-containing subunit